LRLTDARVAGVTVKVVDFDPVPVPAVIVAEVCAVTPVVLTEKVAEVAPSATETDAGTMVLELFDASATVNPPEGAACDRFTVSVGDTAGCKRLPVRRKRNRIDVMEARIERRKKAIL